MTSFDTAYQDILARARGATRPGNDVRVLAVSKTKPAEAIHRLAILGQRAFGENYVQEAMGKQQALSDLSLEWHLIGPLQSNKCRDVAQHFDWLQSLDRPKLIAPLDHARPDGKAPLNILIQVNIDDEASKSGCTPEQAPSIADAIAQTSRLRLRGLMAIPQPSDDPAIRRTAFARMRTLFDRLRNDHVAIDTLSMGMSDDFELAIAEGATMVRLGSALFGAR